MNWVLILFLVTGSGSRIEKIEGFSSKASCDEAGKATHVLPSFGITQAFACVEKK